MSLRFTPLIVAAIAFCFGTPLTRAGERGFPQINVTGNTIDIEADSTTPSGVDGADLDFVLTDSGSVTQTFSIGNTGGGTLNISSVNITGPHAADFTVTTNPAPTVAPSGATTFQITIDPKALGTRQASPMIP